ncbi:MAG: hypothetical protein QM765_20030 [Myxococcales bacterium]
MSSFLPASSFRPLVALTLTCLVFTAHAQQGPSTKASGAGPVDAGKGGASAGPPRAAKPPSVDSIGAATASGGVLPWRVFNRTEGICDWMAYYHLEGIDVTTGKAVWSSTLWTTLIGELPDGALLVDNSGFGGTGALRVAVLERGDGRERFSCAAPFQAAGVTVPWLQVKGVLRGFPFEPSAPSGMPHPQPPPITPITLTFTRSGCAVAAREGVPTEREVVRELPVPATAWTAGALQIRVVTEASLAPDRSTREALVASRDGSTLWSRDVSRPAPPNCQLP